MAEKYLKSNGNDLDATIGDLLAVGAVGDDSSLERMMSISNGGRTSKKPGKILPGGSHAFPGAPSSLAGVTTPSSGGPPGTLGINKDLYHQQMMLNSLSSLQQPQGQGQGQGAAGAGSQAPMTQQLQLLQMQQYMQMPSATVHGYQQMLSQQLLQLKAAKQQVTQQLRQLQMSGLAVQGGGGSGAGQQQQQQQQQQMLQARHNLINQFISHINQQLVLQKYPSQQKDKPGMMDGAKPVTTPGVMGSQQFGRNTPPSRNKDSARMPGPARSLSLPGGANEHSLALGMQGMSMNGHVTPSSISQSSARSVSRLQQIISGSSSSDSPHTADDGKAKFRFPPVSSASTPSEVFDSTSSPLAGNGSNTTTTTPASTPFSPARSFSEIQEFRPGVPWQPRAQPTEPAQLYAKNMPPQQPHPDMRTVQSDPSFSQHGGHNFPPGSGMRPHRRPPTLGYNNPPGGNSAPGGFRARGTAGDQQQRGWSFSSMPRGSTSSPMTNSPFGATATPDKVFSPHAVPFGARSKQQNHQMPPPRSASSLPFNGNAGGRDSGPPLTRPNALFPGPHTFSQAPGHAHSSVSSASSDTGTWGSSSARLPSSSSSNGSSSSHPPTSLTSSMWDSSTASSTGGNQPWSLGLAAGKSDDNPHPSPASSMADPAVPRPHFTSPQHTSSSEGLTPGLGGAWDKGGLRSPDYKSMVLSPEPTFAEWQAGKKAHLSVFKLPSNPPSQWLCIRNVNTQVHTYTYSTQPRNIIAAL